MSVKSRNHTLKKTTLTKQSQKSPNLNFQKPTKICKMKTFPGAIPIPTTNEYALLSETGNPSLVDDCVSDPVKPKQKSAKRINTNTKGNSNFYERMPPVIVEKCTPLRKVELSLCNKNYLALLDTGASYSC